jgi:hypothetical protein
MLAGVGESTHARHHAAELLSTAKAPRTTKKSSTTGRR